MVKIKLRKKQKIILKICLSVLYSEYGTPIWILGNKLNELNTRSASAIINGLLQKDKRLIALLVKIFRAI
nr:hypothetical protein [Spiroplasma melliferum]